MPFRSFSSLQIPEFERVFSQALLDEEADRISYAKLMEKLTGESGNLGISDFMLAGIQDLRLPARVAKPGGGGTCGKGVSFRTASSRPPR